MKYRTIYALWIKLALAKLGFEPIDERTNPNNHDLFCWDYENTPEFRKALDQVFNTGKE